MVGSFAIGCLYGLGSEQTVVSPELKLALMTGFLGGFTTFSAFSLESLLLLESGQIRAGLLNVFLSPLLGLVTCYAGVMMSRGLLKL